MSSSDRKPTAIEPLLTVDHSKRGRRFVTVLDPRSNRVTLLEPWEHAILVLCDGTRGASDIAELLAAGVEGEAVTERSVVRCLKYFEQQEIIENVGFRRQGTQTPAGPRTLAGIQLAYREWHKDPVKTGQILAGQLAPFPLVDGHVPVGLGPTVALPDDDSMAAPVGIGTTLVLGNAEGEFEQERALRSVFHEGTESEARDAEPKTEIGALAEPEDAPEDEEEEDLEIGNVAELLKMVDDDFREQEAASQRPTKAPAEPPPKAPKAKPKHVPPPVGRAMGGVAKVPGPPRAVEPPVQAVERQRRSQLHRAATPEQALNPTMVGLPPEDGEREPVLLSPRRSSSRAGERVGAVIGPEPSPEMRNVTAVDDPNRPPSGIIAGALVEDTQQIETPTEAGYAAVLPTGMDDDDAKTGVLVSEPPRVDESTTSQTSEHIHARARAVFERLRRLGLEARSYGVEAWDGETDIPGQRRREHEAEARQFEEALATLTAGDLEVALAHFHDLKKKLPDSQRVAHFVEAIEAVKPNHDADGGENTRRILHTFEAAVEDAVAAGRCPQCFSTMTSPHCDRCGFETARPTP